MSKKLQMEEWPTRLRRSRRDDAYLVDATPAGGDRG
jgi:hypothetical protein